MTKKYVYSHSLHTYKNLKLLIFSNCCTLQREVFQLLYKFTVSLAHNSCTVICNLISKKFHLTKQPGKPRIDTNILSKPELVEQFYNTLMKKLGSSFAERSTSRKWDKLRNTIHSAALDTFEKKTSKICD